MSAGGHGGRAIVAALLANAGIAIAKFVGFLITGSSSLLAEAGHSLADTTNQALLLLGRRQSERSPDDQHEFGYGMTRYFWSFVVALILFSGGSMFALYEGFQKLRHPHELSSPWVAVGILVVAIGLETYSFRTAIVESRPLKAGMTWWRFIRRSRIPELPVLLLEDAGALLGLIIALTGVGLTVATDDPMWDAVGTLCIGVLLLIIAIILIIEMRSALLGESATDDEKAKVAAAITATPGVLSIIHSRTLHLGPETLLVGAKVEMAADTVLADVERITDNIEARIRIDVPTATKIYIEPAVRRVSS
jgi:cation diffusion facilitator family transporter